MFGGLPDDAEEIFLPECINDMQYIEVAMARNFVWSKRNIVLLVLYCSIRHEALEDLSPILTLMLRIREYD